MNDAASGARQEGRDERVDGQLSQLPLLEPARQQADAFSLEESILFEWLASVG